MFSTWMESDCGKLNGLDTVNSSDAFIPTINQFLID